MLESKDSLENRDHRVELDSLEQQDPEEDQDYLVR